MILKRMLASLFSPHSVKGLHSLTFVYLHNVLSLLLVFVIDSVISRITRMKTARTEYYTCYFGYTLKKNLKLNKLGSNHTDYLWTSVYRSIYFNSLLNNLSLHDYTVRYILSTYLKSEQASETAKWLCQLKIYLTLGHSL